MLFLGAAGHAAIAYAALDITQHYDIWLWKLSSLQAPVGLLMRPRTAVVSILVSYLSLQSNFGLVLSYSINPMATLCGTLGVSAVKLCKRCASPSDATHEPGVAKSPICFVPQTLL